MISSGTRPCRIIDAVPVLIAVCMPCFLEGSRSFLVAFHLCSLHEMANKTATRIFTCLVDENLSGISGTSRILHL